MLQGGYKGQMRTSLVLSCFWPGLVPLWFRGRWSGLVLALAFALVLNVSLLLTFIWPWTVHLVLLLGVWALVGGVWLFGTWRSFRQLRREGFAVEGQIDSPLGANPDQAYRDAQVQYLQGNWLEAEEQLLAMLKDVPEDIEARLMLATMYRHTDQADQAVRQLRLLSRYEGAERWDLEIRKERELLKSKVASETMETMDSADEDAVSVREGEEKEAA